MTPAMDAVPVPSDPYVSIEEACALTGLDRATLYRWIGDGKLHIRPGPPAANGKPISEIQMASLPEPAQATYWSKTRKAKWAAEQPATPAVNLAEVPEPARARALQRQAIVEQALALYTDGRRPSAAELGHLAAAHDLHVNTLYQWLRKYRAGQFPGLLDRHGQTKGRFLALTPLLEEFIFLQYCDDHQPSPTTVRKRVADLCAVHGWRVPCQGTINRFLRKNIPQALADYLRHGPKQWEREHEYKCHRDVSDLAVGEWLCGDHKRADVFVRLTDAPDAPMLRPWYTTYGDIRSRLILVRVFERPTSAGIKATFRAWCLENGIPCHHYADNGRDYECDDINGTWIRFGKAGFPDREKAELFKPGILSAVGIQDHDAIPKKPWGKPIESWFKHIFYEWEKTLPGYAGPDAKQKPEKLEREIKDGRLLTLEEFTQRVAAHVKDYNETPKEVLAGAAPAELWQGVTIERPNPRTLDLLLRKYKQVKVRKNKLALFGEAARPRFYYHEALWRYSGDWVDVYYDPAHLGSVVVMAEGKYLCEAANDEAMRYGASTEAFARLKRKKRASKAAMLAYREHQRILYRPEEALAVITAQVRAQKLVSLHPDPDPRPGTHSIPRIIPPFDQAAIASSRPSRRASCASAARETLHATTHETPRTQEERTPPAPPAAAPAAVWEPDLSDPEADKDAIIQQLNAMYR